MIVKLLTTFFNINIMQYYIALLLSELEYYNLKETTCNT